ncbi:hypothetical protein [Cognatiluteimonas profundi]|uniref:hypothetical protein n=1 Tax=Cognatiluteimonas profundi TaxID=2594501 RepID=UPI00131EA49A|nr:hypothetical protein [Lysobacter profundi]
MQGKSAWLRASDVVALGVGLATGLFLLGTYGGRFPPEYSLVVNVAFPLALTACWYLVARDLSAKLAARSPGKSHAGLAALLVGANVATFLLIAAIVGMVK